MDLFQSPDDSHTHSLRTLQSLNAYDDFMDNIQVVCDMGCGYGKDLFWWANNTYEDDHGTMQPRNYLCFGVDLDTTKIPTPRPKNVRVIQRDFEEEKVVNVPVDLVWSHDSFRYATNPLQTLKNWNAMMNENGMLVLIVPQMVNIVYRQPVVRTFPGCYFSYNITNLMYMLAVSGFDCRDGHFVKYANDPWVHCVVYKNDRGPLDPKTTSWYKLSDLGLLPKTADDCISKYGYLKQELLQTHWLDGQFIDWSKV